MSITKSHLLDPFNVMVKLSMLNLCEYGTRLSIYRNIVIIQPPGYIQILNRSLFRDDRDDLYLLIKSIIKIVEWYTTENLLLLKDSSETKYENLFYKNEEIKELIQYAVLGLDKLQKFYSSFSDDGGMCVIGLQLMINILNDGIDEKYDIKKLPIKYRSSDNISLFHIQETMGLWKGDKLSEILNLLRDAHKHIKYDISILPSEIINGYIKDLSKKLDMFDKNFQEIVMKSYS